jgi:TRAP-type C4-dicarboxylate transport system permease small subunit
MTALKAAFREVAGLFVEDGALALAIIAIVIIAGVFARLLPDTPSVAGGILLFGCLAALGTNVARAARR